MSSIFETKMHLGKITWVILIALFLSATKGRTQLISQSDKAQQIQLNTITTAVPFLLIAPDS